MSYYLNKNVEDLNRIFDQNSRRQYLRLDLNENPGGLPEEFVKKVASEITPQLVAEYPETLAFTHCLAEYLGAEIENICLVNGSAEGIRHIIEAFSSATGKIIGVFPTYAMFEVYSKMYGRNFLPITYSETLEMPASSILEKMDDDVDLLILVNPNNPIGNAYSESDFQLILQKAKEKQITILVDEAYHYFYPDTFLNYALTNDHVFITRTFSKLFSLAGLRLGYVVGNKRDISMVQKLCTPHNVNAISMLFAQRIIEEPGVIESLIDKHKEGRTYLELVLKENGYSYHGENGNFIFIRPKTDAKMLVKRMKDTKSILIKSYDGIGKLGTCLRVTTAEKKYMHLFAEALLELDR